MMRLCGVVFHKDSSGQPVFQEGREKHKSVFADFRLRDERLVFLLCCAPFQTSVGVSRLHDCAENRNSTHEQNVSCGYSIAASTAVTKSTRLAGRGLRQDVDTRSELHASTLVTLVASQLD